MTTTSEQDENLDEGQPLVDHLIELRSRVLRSLVAVFAIFGVSDDPTFNSRYNVLPTNYSGPTGITSVVGHELRNSGIETSGLWAAVPHYLSSGSYPKGISALLNKSAEILKIDIDDTGIQSEGQQFETKIKKAMENSEDLAEYVAKLEDAELTLEDTFSDDSDDSLVQQIEEFLNNESGEV